MAEGAQGPRTSLFVARRVWESRDELPGRAYWLLLRRNRDGSEARYYLSNAPANTPLGVLARVAAARWTIETEFQMAKGETGLDAYEVRGWRGWHHHMALALLAAAFLLTLQQDWGGKMPLVTRPQLSRVLRALLPQRHWTDAALLQWRCDTQRRTEQSHIKRRLRQQHEQAALALAA